ncbi:hypothetical protein GCM10026987_15000 [Belliella aquatica]|uniref:Fido domain-containing protein n=2 Tax=Belliella aquatica TaxID=1323734 RepID=A0ABQ1LPH7_9BACT|nr:hypothetical protein [Belliella aquatica]GGC26901.1 hypothetical protein GCM10010993_02460 [Belliella aquatica]
MDGNKRTGYVLMRLVLMNFGKDIDASHDEKYDLVISVASGKFDFEAILEWVNQHTSNL